MDNSACECLASCLHTDLLRSHCVLQRSGNAEAQASSQPSPAVATDGGVDDTLGSPEPSPAQAPSSGSSEEQRVIVVLKEQLERREAQCKELEQMVAKLKAKLVTERAQTQEGHAQREKEWQQKLDDEIALRENAIKANWRSEDPRVSFPTEEYAAEQSATPDHDAEHTGPTVSGLPSTPSAAETSV